MRTEAGTAQRDLKARLTDGSLSGDWALDASRSSVSLRSKSMWGMAPVKGSFSDVSGRAVISPAGQVSGTITVGAASINTNNAKRDTHLRSADFFETDAYPHIVFTAEQVTLNGAGATVTGTLQVRDRSLPLTVPVAVSAPSGNSIELDAEIVIDRSEFGLTWNQLGMASMKNTLTVSAVFTRS